MKRTFLLFLILSPILLQSLYADKKYDEWVKEISHEVWNWDAPEFNNYVVPAEYDTCSMIILAWHNQINANRKGAVRFDPTALLFATVSISNNKQIIYTNTERFLIKLNDQNAINNYSEINFQQHKNMNRGFLFKHSLNSIVGARVIKTDGRIIAVDTSEAAYLLDEKKDKQRKLAIPDLQIGDILDYFIMDELKVDNADFPPMTFLFAHDHPVLKYSIHCDIDKDLAIEYRSMNGAPSFLQERNPENSNITLDIRESNLPVWKGEIWTNFLRQVPIIRLQIYNIGSPYSGALKSMKKGSISIDPPLGEVLKSTLRSASEDSWGWAYNKDVAYQKEMTKVVKRYMQNNPEASSDEIISFAYYAYRHFLFNSIYKDGSVVVDQRRNFRKIDERRITIMFERFIHNFNKKTLKSGDKYFLTFAASKDSPTLDEFFSPFDADFIITKSEYPSFSYIIRSPFSHAWFLPAKYEQENAVGYLVEKYQQGEGKTKVTRGNSFEFPSSSKEENQSINNLVVSLTDDYSNLIIDRETNMSGNLREIFQPILLLFEDYEAESRNFLGIEESLFEEMEKDRNLRKLKDDYKNAFEEARKEQEDYFKFEANQYHECDINTVLDYKILNSGLFHTSPNFQYKTKYHLENTVLKAGSDYIINLGNLISKGYNPTPQERDRKVDAYMSYARRYQYNIVFNIPEGYQIDDIDNLNYSVENKYGCFISSADISDNELKITVFKDWDKKYIPVEDWGSLLQLIDATNDFFNQTILLRNTKDVALDL